AGRYSLNMAEGHPDAFGADARLRAWAVAMGGGTVMHLRWDIASTPLADLEDCGRLVSFMQSTDFERMAPRDDLAFGGTEYVLASPDSYILYASQLLGDIGVSGIAAGLYDLRWIDIPTGVIVEETGINVAGGDASWTPPAAIGGEVAVWVRPSSGSSAPPMPGPGPAPPPPANTAPVAAFSATPASGQAPLDVTFDASASTDTDGTIVSYAWDFGDGASGTGPVVQHTYVVGGYTVSLTVTDDGGATGASSASITASGSTGYTLLVSASPDRTNPTQLEGQAMSGLIYVFTSPDQGVSTTTKNRVKFWLDDPAMSGAPRQQEKNPPYDFAGGSSTIADPFDTSAITAGSHTITAALPLSDGTTAVVHANFTVQ
ncbi:MAG: PKD domain-containing protein, partial [Alphaproteobacteria bacterium]